MLNKINLAVTAALLILCGVLSYKVFTNHQPSAAELSPAPRAAAFANGDSVRAPVIAYVNGDSIMMHYEAFKVMEQNIKNSYKTSSERVEKEMAEAQKQYNELVEWASKQGDKLSKEDAEAAQQSLMELEAKIQRLKAEEEDKLLRKENELNNTLMKDIREYLERYSAQHGIDMVMNYMEVQQTVLYGNGDFDITQSVIEGLNAEYALKKSQGQE
jgi:outer membrane protein